MSSPIRISERSVRARLMLLLTLLLSLILLLLLSRLLLVLHLLGQYPHLSMER